ncbi:hypothetical protein BX666DRAFT_1874954 [Dichotomocladium elegans]|nr:hypothetical protein BX666DRAFT_1874954 [Dichotomocladium elegans]
MADAQKKAHKRKLLPSAAKTSADPVIHYNGPYETLDQLPDEKLQWIRREPVEAEGLRHPLADCPKSIVLRKPVTRSQTFYTDCPTKHQKTDVDEDSTVTLKIFAQPKPARRGIGQHHGLEDVMIGTETFSVPLQACEKQLRRMALKDSPACQILAIYGTFVSKSVQVLFDDKCLHQDYMTVYIRGQLMPKWERFWAALHGTVLLLYDFEYRATKPPLYRVPLDFFVQVAHPSSDDERQVDAGPHGLALQFTEHALSKHALRCLEEETDAFECRMYILPDSADASRRWKEMLAYVASLLDQYRQMSYGDLDSEETNTGSFISSSTSTIMGDECEKTEQETASIGIAVAAKEDDTSPISVPSKFMW